MNSPTFIEFLTKFLHDIPGNIFLVVDGASYHHSTDTTKFVESHHTGDPASASYPRTHPISTPTSGTSGCGIISRAPRPAAKTFPAHQTSPK
ncbi:MAG: transposase [Pseudonocardia sp.]|nr:transposase [Pseudonocardia sp.]